MMPLIETLYRVVSEKWNLALGLLDSEEYFEYHQCYRFCDQQDQRWAQQLTGDELAAWKSYVANVEQVRDTECRLCFARGLAMGLSLGRLAAGE